MQQSKINPPTLIILGFVVATGILRIIFNFNTARSPLANFSPLGAMALFGGAYFNSQWKAYAFPLLTIFLSDVFLSHTVFKPYSSGILYNGWYWVYGAFALMVLTGRLMIRTHSIRSILLATIVVVFIHWIVTDMGVWINGDAYLKTMAGFIDCLTAAIPFELRFLTGTLVYGGIMFGVIGKRFAPGALSGSGRSGISNVRSQISN